MLKNFGYAGAYRDGNISASVLLENPLDCELDASALVFGVSFKGSNGTGLCPDDFTFYIMDETNQLHNTRYIPGPAADGLICTDFKPEFLFQDLRIAFYYRPYGTISVIALSH